MKYIKLILNVHTFSLLYFILIVCFNLFSKKKKILLKYITTKLNEYFIRLRNNKDDYEVMQIMIQLSFFNIKFFDDYMAC